MSTEVIAKNTRAQKKQRGETVPDISGPPKSSRRAKVVPVTEPPVESSADPLVDPPVAEQVTEPTAEQVIKPTAEPTTKLAAAKPVVAKPPRSVKAKRRPSQYVISEPNKLRMKLRGKYMQEIRAEVKQSNPNAISQTLMKLAGPIYKERGLENKVIEQVKEQYPDWTPKKQKNV